MRVKRIGVLTVILCVVVLLAGAEVWAHGGGTSRLNNEVAGPYRLYAWTSPEPLRAGDVHMTFAVTLPPDDGITVDESTLLNDLEQVVIGAELAVRLIPLSNPDNAFTIMAEPSNINPVYYETDMDLPLSDEWQAIIHVSGELGQGEASFQSFVEEPRWIDWRWVGGTAALLLVLIGVSRSRSMSMKRRAMANA